MEKRRTNCLWRSVIVLFWMLSQCLDTSSAFVPPAFSTVGESRHVGESGIRRQSVQRKARSYANDDLASFVATCVPGLSKILAQELEDLGCRDVTTTGSSAVRFQADGATALRTLVWARTPHKLLELLGESPPTLQNRQDLHQYVHDEIPVAALLGDGKGGLLTLSVSTLLNAPRSIPADINHSHFTALTVKNALCDKVRELRGDRPSVDLVNPDVPLMAVLRGTPSGAQLSLFRQLHVNSLHKRGYRPPTIHKASLKESLAAGLLLQAGWQTTCRKAQQEGELSPLLLDPMAGSGTLVLEGLFIAADLAPHLLRIKTADAEVAQSHQLPPMLRWKDYSDLRSTVWPDLLREAAQRAKVGLQWLRSSSEDSACRIQANDIHTGALALLEESLEICGVTDLVELTAGDCADWQPRVGENGDSSDKAAWTVASNPPWGVRLTDDVEESWEAMGEFLKQKCPPGRTTAYLLSGDAVATKRLGLRRSQSMPVKVGTQDLRWLQYELHTPSEREESQEEARIVRDEERKARREMSPVRPVVVQSAEPPRVEARSMPRTPTAPRKARTSKVNEWLLD
jgi:23S rRNA G2445 N2-methylase RlmL